MAITDKIRKLFEKIHGISPDELAELKYMFEHTAWQKGAPPEGCVSAYLKVRWYGDTAIINAYREPDGGWGSEETYHTAEDILWHYPLDDIIEEGKGLE